ncbi:MAG: aminopeptidase [Sphaerochaetaceae bacterium]|nr:aminopeptidase [Sphaerochaetaceae bacterium]
MDFDLYADRIIKEFLRLKDGDALSINTEDVDFQFAATIAKKALQTTNVTVKIVVTENGKPVEVTDFDVEGKNPSVARRMAMLRLKHVKKAFKDEKLLEAEVEKDDLAALHKLGHLADPIVTGRRISVPWCVVPVFEDPESEDAQITINKALDEKINNNIRLADYRKSYMGHSDMDTVHLFADDCDLTVRVPANISFIGGTSTLSDGRTYVNSIDFDKISFAVDKNSAEGKIRGTASVFGKTEDVELEFNNSNVKIIQGSDKLKKLFSFDEELKKIGYITLSDKDFSLSLGGSLQESLDSQQTVDTIPSYFNTSIYSLNIKLNDKLSVTYSNFAGRETELVRRGFFLD